MTKSPTRIKAIILAGIVTFIWATSWIMIKEGLKEIPALTFAGLRYSIAVVVLMPFFLRKNTLSQVKLLQRNDWIKLLSLGVVGFAFAQGALFLGLSYLPTVTIGLVLNLSSLFVAWLSNFALKERPTWLQWTGVLLNLIGILFYFSPSGAIKGNGLGWLFAGISLFANVVGSIITRSLNRGGRINPLIVTVISMGFGALLMLFTGILWQGLPPFGLKSFMFLMILAVINTALCFVLWNYSSQTLTATESSIINSLMLVQVAILAWVFLGETQDLKQIIGLVLALAGVVVVQLRFRKKPVFNSLNKIE
jgi:drug/metabolite transporter (DMT)-like permease